MFSDTTKPLFNINNRYAVLVYLSLAFLLCSFVTRMVLYVAFGYANQITLWQLPSVLLLGLLNDLIEAVYYFMPFALYLWLMPEKIYASRIHQVFLALLTYITLFILLYVCVMEYYFFEEYSARFNLVAVDYLIYHSEVLTNIWEAYPVVKGSIACAIGALVLTYFVWSRIRRATKVTLPLKQRSKVMVGHALVLGILMATLHTHSFDNSNNRISNEIAANGISSIFEAFHTNKLDYPAYYRTDDSKKLQSILVKELQNTSGEFVALEKNQLNRRHRANPQGLGKLNVVVIGEESLGAKFIGSYHLEQDLTPNFDKLAKDGMLFTRMYATGTRTVRGLEAIASSFPPIPSESIVKRPGSENIANWGEVMKRLGYSASFLYGGYGAFDNMNYFFKNNGFQISDRTDIKDVTFSNVWGVCDEDLFRHSIGYFNKMAQDNKPFFAIIMSTSNHKPYTFPAGIKDIPVKGGGRSAGVRYADYALGQFFKMAKKQKWFDNTIFIVVGDHDARVYGAAMMPVYSYKVPLLVYAPKHIQPQKVDIATSQIDIAPTILGLLGLAYEAPFFGQDVLNWPAGVPRTVLLNHNHDVAALQGDKLTVLSMLKKTQTYRYHDKTKTLVPIESDPKLLDLATAYYQTAYELFKSHRYVLLDK